MSRFSTATVNLPSHPIKKVRSACFLALGLLWDNIVSQPSEISAMLHLMIYSDATADF